MKLRILSILLLATVAFAACGDEEPSDTIQPTLPVNDGGGAGDTVMAPVGPTMTVAELLAAEGEGPYSVKGYLFVLEDGRVILSDAIAESYPPQPGGDQIEVRGANLQGVPLEEPTDSELATVQWTNEPIELIGWVEDGVFHGSTPATI